MVLGGGFLGLDFVCPWNRVSCRLVGWPQLFKSTIRSVVRGGKALGTGLVWVSEIGHSDHTFCSVLTNSRTICVSVDASGDVTTTLCQR